MQTKGQLMKSFHTAFSFAPPSILSLTILMSLLYHNDTIIKKEKELLRALLIQFCKLEVIYQLSNNPYKRNHLLFQSLLQIKEGIFIALYEYYGAAEPPVRCGESHLSGLTEPPHFVY